MPFLWRDPVKTDINSGSDTHQNSTTTTLYIPIQLFETGACNPTRFSFVPQRDSLNLNEYAKVGVSGLWLMAMSGRRAYVIINQPRPDTGLRTPPSAAVLTPDEPSAIV